jgi:predicted RNase H-like HicB family nuclease
MHSVSHTYTIRIEPDALDGGFIASVVDLPGCMSQGETSDEALENVVEALTLTLTLEVEGERDVRALRPVDAGGHGTATEKSVEIQVAA